MKPKIKVPTSNVALCLTGIWILFWYVVLSVGLAFLFHRICFYNTPLLAAFSSKFAAGVFLLSMLGLYTWTSFRVFVYLLVPKLCNINGRTLMMAYIAYLTITGPIMNAKRNIGVMSTSLVCSYEQVVFAYHDLVEMALHPIVFIKDLIQKLETEAKAIFKALAAELEVIRKSTENLSR